MKKNCFLRTINLTFLLLAPLLNAGSATVSWNANSELDLAGYKIYYGKSSGSYESQVYVGNVTSYHLTGLEEGKHYYFAVTALDFSGNESTLSKEVGTTISEDTSDDQESGNETNNTQTFIGQAYNYPNPFKIDSEKTIIRYELQNSAEVTIEIMDSNTNFITNLIKNEFRPAGENTGDVWDGRNSAGRFVANGVYFCNIRTSLEQKIIKIAVTR